MLDEDRLIMEAEHALRAGQKGLARRLLDQVVDANPQHGYGWYLLSQTTDILGQRTSFLAQAHANGYRHSVDASGVAIPPHDQSAYKPQVVNTPIIAAASPPPQFQPVTQATLTPAPARGAVQPAHNPVSSGRRLIAFCSGLLLLAFLLPWYRVGANTVDEAAWDRLSRSERDERIADVYTLFGSQVIPDSFSDFFDPYREFTTNALHGALAWIAFVSIAVLGVIALQPLLGFRIQAWVGLDTWHDRDFLWVCLLVAVPCTLFSVSLWFNSTMDLAFGFYLALFLFVYGVASCLMRLPPTVRGWFTVDVCRRVARSRA